MYQCVTCRVAFNEADVHRQHYKSDWHRYNLKRKVADLPPVTLEQFQVKASVAKQQEEQQHYVSKSGTDNNRGGGILCQVCNKQFSSDNAYTNHVNSRKHRDLAESSNNLQLQEKKGTQSSNGRKVGQDRDGANEREAEGRINESDGDEDEDEWEDVEDAGAAAAAVPVTSCLFCDHTSSQLQDNVTHMSRSHSFFIPDLEYVTDLSALITYLGYKVHVGHVCLWCNDHGKTFRHLTHVRRHMNDTGHCKMRFDGDAVYEFADFYDYSSTYPDEEQHLMDTEMTGDDLMTSLDVDDVDGNCELKLPSGRTIGHRSLLRYYRQNLVPYHNLPPSSGTAGRRGNRRAVKDALSHYKAIGWISDQQSICQQKQTVLDMKYLHSWKQKRYQQLGVKSNKLQKHFRSQITWK